MLGTGLVQRRVDPAGLTNYLTFGSAYDPLSLIEGVQRPSAGELGHLEGWRLASFSVLGPCRRTSEHGAKLLIRTAIRSPCHQRDSAPCSRKRYECSWSAMSPWEFSVRRNRFECAGEHSQPWRCHAKYVFHRFPRSPFLRGAAFSRRRSEVPTDHHEIEVSGDVWLTHSMPWICPRWMA